MKQLVKIFGFLIVLLTIIACEPDQLVITERDYPLLRTLEVTQISVNGAQFNAEYIYRGDAVITSYGFVWNTVPYPSLTTPSTDKIEFNENISTDKYSVFIDHGLQPGAKYYVRAFTQTEDYLVYGPNIIFTSKGSGN